MATYNEVAAAQLTRLVNSLGIAGGIHNLLETQRFLFGSWGNLEVPASPPYPSYISDDHSPFEHSVAFEQDRTVLRLMVESQAPFPTLKTNQAAALALQEQLVRRYGIPSRRFDAVKDLFLSPDPKEPFSLWHAFGYHPQRAPEFKTYFNPQVHGPQKAPELILNAFTRLGFRNMKDLLRALTPRGEDDWFSFFSLDLADHAATRVKVYARHKNATAADLERIFTVAREYRPGDVREFCRAVIGTEGPFGSKPLTSCFAFLGTSNEPATATLHFPISRYVPPSISAYRLRAYLEAQELDPTSYVRTLEALGGNLTSGANMQTYASMRRERGRVKVTVYLAPGLFERQAVDYRDSLAVEAMSA